jgi:hypothetical protein
MASSKPGPNAGVTGLSFEQVSRFKNLFQKQAAKEPVNRQLSRVELEKRGTVGIEHLPELVRAAGIKAFDAEIAIAQAEIVCQRQHAIDELEKRAAETIANADDATNNNVISVKNIRVISPESGANRMTSEDFMWALSHPAFTLTLRVEESIAAWREKAITEYAQKLLDSNESVRASALRDPPNTLLGDKQAVRVLAKHMHTQTLDQEIRITMAQAVAHIAEKPREVSGEQVKPGQKRVKIYDTKALAAFKHTLALSDAPCYLDVRTFRNREPKLSPVEVEDDLIETWRSLPHAEQERFLSEIPTERQSEALYLYEFRTPVHELCDAVRIAAVKVCVCVCR